MSVDLGSAHGLVRIDYDGSQVRNAISDMGMLGSAGRNLGMGLQGAGLAVGAVGVGLTKVIGEMVDVASTVQAGLKSVEASSGATGQVLEDLQNTVITLGKDTVFTSQEIVGAADAMVKAGISAEQLNEGVLKATSDLASATGEGLGVAGKTMADAVNLFDLSAEQAGPAADIITKAVNASAIGLTQYQAGFRNLAPMMAGFADNSEEAILLMADSAEAVSFFTSEGLKAADAGLSWGRVIQNIAVPSMEKYGDALDAAGISAFDANGEFRGTGPIIEDLREALVGMTDEEMTQTIKSWGLGAEALDVLQVAATSSAGEYDEFVGKLRDGLSASEAASIRLEGLSGAIELFTGSLSAAFFDVGTNLLAPLEMLVRGALGVVNAFLLLPKPLKEFIALAGGVSAVVFTAGGGFLLFAGTVVRLAEALRLAGFSLGAFMGLFTLVSAAIVTGVVAYQTNFLGFADAVDGAIGGLGENFQRFGDQFKETFDELPRRMNDVSKFLHAFASGLRAIGGEDTPAFLVTLAHNVDAAGEGVQRAIRSFARWRSRGLSPISSLLRSIGRGLHELDDVPGVKFLADTFEDLSIFAEDFGNALAAGWLTAQRTGFDGIAAQVSALGFAIENVLGLDVSAVFDEIAGHVQLLQKYFSSLIESGMNPFEAVLRTVFEAVEMLTGVDLNGFFDRVSEAAGGVTDRIGKIIGAVDDVLRALVTGDWEHAANLIRGVALALKEDLGNALGQTVNWVLDVGAPQLGGWLMDHNPIDWIKEQLQDKILPAVGTVLGAIATWILNVGLPRLGDWLAEHNPLTWVKEQIMEFFDPGDVNILAEIRDWVFEVGVPTLKTWASNVYEWVRETLGEMIPDPGDETPLAALKNWALDIAAPTVVKWVTDMVTWVEGKIAGMLSELGDITVTFDDWTLDVKMPGDEPGTEKGFTFNVATATEILKIKIQALINGIRLAAIPFSNWALSILFPSEGNSMGGPGERGETGAPDLTDWPKKLYDKIAGLLETIKIEAIPFGNWAINIIEPSDEDITINTDAIITAVGNRVKSLLNVGSEFYNAAGEIGRTIGAFLGEAIAAGINAIFASQEASGIEAGLASGRGFGAPIFSFGDAFANFDTQFTEAFKEAVDPAFERIKAALGQWLEDKKTELWDGLWLILMSPIGPSSDAEQEASKEMAKNAAGADFWAPIGDFISHLNPFQDMPKNTEERMVLGSGVGGGQQEMATTFGSEIGKQFAAVMSSQEFADSMEAGFTEDTDSAKFEAAAMGLMSQFTIAIGDALRSAEVDPGDTTTEPGGNVGNAVASTMIAAISSSLMTVDTSQLEEAAGELVDRINTSINTVLMGDSMGGPGERGEAGTGGFANFGTDLMATLSSSVSSADATGMEVALKGTVGVAVNNTMQDTQLLISLEMIDWFTEFSTGFTNINTATTNGMQTMNTTVSTAMTDATESVSIAVAAIEVDFGTLPTTATTSGTGVDTGFSTGLNGLQTGIQELEGAMTTIRGTLEAARGDAFTAGAALAQGFAAGMRSALGEITAAADEMVAAADKAVQAKAKISSPSKLFIERGYESGVGYAIGFEDAIPQVMRVSTQMVSQLEAALMELNNVQGFSDIAGIQEDILSIAEAGDLTQPALQEVTTALNELNAASSDSETTQYANTLSQIAGEADGATAALDTASMSWREFNTLADSTRAAAAAQGLLPTLPSGREWAEDFSAVRRSYFDVGVQVSQELGAGVEQGLAETDSASKAATEYSSQFTETFWSTTQELFRGQEVNETAISDALSAMSAELKAFQGDQTPQEIVDIALALDQMALSGDFTAQELQNLQEELSAIIPSIQGPKDGLVSASNAMDTMSKTMAQISGQPIETELGRVYDSTQTFSEGLDDVTDSVTQFDDTWQIIMSNIQAFGGTEGIALGEKLIDTVEFKSALDQMTGDTQVAMNYFAAIFTSGLDAANDYLTEFSDWLGSGQGGQINEAAKTIGTSITDGTFQGLQNLKETLSPELYAIFAPALQELGDIIAPAFGEAGATAGEQMFTEFSNWWDQVKALMTEWQGFIGSQDPAIRQQIKDMRAAGDMDWQTRLGMMSKTDLTGLDNSKIQSTLDQLTSQQQSMGTIIQQNSDVIEAQSNREYQVSIPVSVNLDGQVIGETIAETAIGGLINSQGRNSVRRTGRV